ncbi:MAG: hypothetical protein LBG20_03315 [Holosporaceae bacterium]|jgi:hypothetical protein|nr:hypothetical protein [Holosporaceae bacterium]
MFDNNFRALEHLKLESQKLVKTNKRTWLNSIVWFAFYTSDGNNPFIWRISRFRLFRRESGTSSFVNCLPQLISANQDGYEISANSEADSVHVAVNAFDENADTKWATQAGDHLKMLGLSN